jgi:NAD(P)-dependent dehydrogenase (short-subunit alcohol dehydrogenase family)
VGVSVGVARDIFDPAIQLSVTRMQVYITSRNADACKKTADALTLLGPGQCFSLAEDLSSEAGCLKFAARFGEMEDRCHILVNNSGIAWGAEFDKFPEAVRAPA